MQCGFRRQDYTHAVAYRGDGACNANRLMLVPMTPSSVCTVSSPFSHLCCLKVPDACIRAEKRDLAKREYAVVLHGVQMGVRGSDILEAVFSLVRQEGRCGGEEMGVERNWLVEIGVCQPVSGGMGEERVHRGEIG